MDAALATLRRRAIQQTLFTAPSLAGALDRLGFVQADPLRAPARAQDLILRQRVPGYKAGDLERHYPAIGVDEELLHVYGFVSSRVRDLLHPRLHEGEWDPEEGLDEVAREVLYLLRRSDPLHPREVERELGSHTVVGAWGSNAKATTHALQALHYRGLLRIARRDKGTRVYEAIPITPNPTPPHDRARDLVLTVTFLYAPIPERSLRQLLRMLHWGAPDAPKLAPLKTLLEEGRLTAQTVDGVSYISPTGEVPPDETPSGAHLLAPFDPIVWDRARFEHLWGWPYRFEAYTPATKRQWGHYALPLLWQDEVIGWANLNYKAGDLQADLGFVRSRPRSRAFTVALDEELDDMRQFLQPR